MKKCLSLVFAFIFAVGICFSAPVTINASAATTDELTFELNGDGKSYSVSKCNESANGEISIPASYNNLPVTKIGASAFYHCVSITNVNIPSSVVTIDESAFMYCDSLTSVTIPDSVKTIGDRAFHSCPNIKSVKLGSKVETIGINAFFASESLTTLVIPNSVKSLGQAAFAYCTNLTSVKIGNGVSKMGTGVFYFCSKLSSVTISEGVTVIGETAFLGCEALKSITVPSTVKTIGTQALGYSNSNAKTKGFVINGKSDSVAQKYATENGFTFKATSSVKKLSTPSVKIANTAKGIKVSWGSVANAESYTVYRSTYNASTKKWSKWSTIKKGVTATSYTDTKVKLGTSYKYTVRAVNGSVMSGYKGSAGLKYNVTPTVKVANASNGVKVSWSTAANATGYTVYSSTYNAKTKKWSGWKNRGTTKATTTAWVDKSVKSGTYYKYTVRACNGKSIKSSYKASANMLYLAMPTVKIANNANGIKVSWNKVTGSKGYTVYRSEYVNGSWSKWKNMGTAKNTQTSWVDKSAVSGVQYKYTARVVNGNYKSVYKETGALIYLSQPTVNVETVNNGIKVTWNKVAGATAYTVYSATYDEVTGKWSSWKNLGNVSTTSWVGESAVSGTTYRYTVRAISGSFKSTYKSSNSVIYLSVPVVTTKTQEDSIIVSWLESTGAEYYEVYRSELVNGNWSKWEEMTDCSTLTWQDYEIKEGVYYRYTVVAVKGANRSTFTATDKAVVIAQPEVKMESVGNGIRISWNKVTGAESYSVYRCVYNYETEKYDKVCILNNSTATSYTDTTGDFGEWCYYTVCAITSAALSKSASTDLVAYDVTPVTVASVKSDGIHVSWNKIKGADGYAVYRSEYNVSTGTWSDWAWIKDDYTLTEYVDTDVVTGTYKYSVCAIKRSFYGSCGVSGVVQCEVPVYVSIGNKKITFSDNAESLKASFGTPSEILVSKTSSEKISYYVYSGNYSKLTIVTLTDSDGVVSVYTLDTSAVFKTGFTQTSFTDYNGKFYVYNTNHSTEYFIDELGTKNVYAVMFSKRDISANNTDISGDIKTYEKLNFHCTNACRAINGVKTLSYNESVANVARAHSQDMADRNYFAHETPEGRSPGDRLTSAGINWWTYGENIDAGYRTPFDMCDGWYNSSGHRKNMLNSNFTYLGVGIAYNSNSYYGFYGTQNFVAF